MKDTDLQKYQYVFKCPTQNYPYGKTDNLNWTSQNISTKAQVPFQIKADPYLNLKKCIFHCK